MEKQWRQQLSSSVSLLVTAWPNKKERAEVSDMIDCSDLPLWALLRFSFFVCLGFVLWFWFFSHSLLFLL